MRFGEVFDRSRQLRILAVTVVLSLFAVNYATDLHSLDVASQSLDDIFDNAVPSEHHIAAILRLTDGVRNTLRTFYVPGGRRDDAEKREVQARVQSDLDSINHHVTVYERLPTFPGEPEQQRHLDARIASMAKAIEATFATHDHDAASHRVGTECVPEIEAAEATLRDILDIDADAAAELARGIVRAHEHARRVALVVMVVSLFAIIGIWLIVDQSVRRGEGKSRQKIDELDAFAGRVAHDLRGPLSPMLMAISMIRLELGENAGERSLSSLQRLETAVRRMTGLIEGLLDFARSGAAHAASTPARAGEVVDGLIATLRPFAEQANAELHVDVERGLVIGAAPGVVTSIIQNLVRNAVNYLGESARRAVTLRVRTDEARPRFVRIEVTDTGPGIPEDVRRRLFNPFERGSTAVVGYGLGLATVKRLAEGHGGSVSVVTQIGVGSTFEVRLPRFARAS